MKFYLKRGKLNVFQEAKIEIDNIDDLTGLQMALYNQINYYKGLNWHESEDKEVKAMYDKAVELYDCLNVNNAIHL